MSGFALADHGAIDGHAMRDHIFDLKADHMAAAQRWAPFAGDTGALVRPCQSFSGAASC